MQHFSTEPNHRAASRLVIPTIGLCHWTRSTDAGQVVEFASGEFVHVRTPTPSVIVQAIGGPLPSFAVPCNVLDERQDIELVILHEAPWLGSGEGLPERLQAFSPKGRAIVVNQALDGQLTEKGALPRSEVLIDAAALDLEVVAESLATILTGKLLACIDWLDIISIAGGKRGKPGRGRAIVVNGIGDECLAIDFHEELARLKDEGFDGGLLLMQLVTSQDRKLLTLERLDGFAAKFREGVGERDLLLTASTDASRNAVVVVAFRAVADRAR